ncbi:hypothetical protein [Streptomyces sp. Tu 3180]|uniref:hypothetical protein n=1 Tax=Streptomyces sp. Tu 3180 TaxID=2682611 RepID=UPI0013577496|nr:hypothetical protein [Streptomyces sp. Tu 3180]KAF3463557.1 hypothetical protein GL259_03985 [Streptomyces sp. Tu 3180]
MTVRDEALLAELGSLPAPVRADYLRVLETVVRTVPGAWTRRRGVRRQWITLRDGDDDVVVRVESGELSEHVDWDGPRSARSFAGALRERLATNRCAALVYGNAVDSRTWGWVLPLLAGQLPRLDTAVMVEIEHRAGARSTFSFPVGYRRLPVRRLRFEQDVRAVLRRAGNG